MSRPKPILRQELMEARADVERQIGILRAGPASLGKGGAFINNSGLIARLTGVLGELDDSLANLGNDNA